jgi:hypothetical protein
MAVSKALDTGFLIDLWIAGGVEALDALKTQLDDGVIFYSDTIKSELTNFTSTDISGLLTWIENPDNAKFVDYTDSILATAVKTGDDAAIDAARANAGERALIELTSGREVVSFGNGRIELGDDLPMAKAARAAAGIPDGPSVIMTSDSKFKTAVLSSTTKQAGFSKFGLADAPIDSKDFSMILLDRGFDKETIKAWNEKLRTDSNIGLSSGAKKQILSTSQVDDFDPETLSRSGVNTSDIPWYKLAKYSFLVTVANKLGLIGDVASLMVTTAYAEDLREQGKVEGANETWVKFLFETTGGFAAGLAAFVALNSLVPSPHPYAVIGKFGLAIAASVLGSWGGAALGEFVYQEAKQALNEYFDVLYARSMPLQMQSLMLLREQLEGFSGSMMKHRLGPIGMTFLLQINGIRYPLKVAMMCLLGLRRNSLLPVVLSIRTIRMLNSPRPIFA